MDEPANRHQFLIINTAWSSVFTFFDAIFIMIFIKRLWREIKAEWIDFFKITQYLTVIIVLSIEIIRLFNFLMPEQLFIILYHLYTLNRTNVFNFELSNQFWWATMIMHLKYYKTISPENKDAYHAIKKTINRNEKIIMAVYILILIISNFINIYIIAIQIIWNWSHKVHNTSKNINTIQRYDIKIWKSIYFMMDYALHWYKYGMMIILWTSQIVLFYMLRHELKRELHYYYRKTKRGLRLIVFLTITYFMAHFTYIFDFYYMNIKRDIILYLDNFPCKYTVSETIFSMFISFTINTPLYMLCYYSIKNINFSIYLCDILWWLDLYQYYPEASIFTINHKEDSASEDNVSYTINDDRSAMTYRSLQSEIDTISKDN